MAGFSAGAISSVRPTAIPTDVGSASDIDGEKTIAVYTPLQADDGRHYTSEGLLRLNYATIDELRTLSGIGESTAKKIIEYRETRREFGGFIAKAELMLISGIGETTYGKIEPYVTVE